MPNSDCNLGSGLASAAYEKDGGHGHIGSFAEPLPSDLAYSPPPPDDDRSIRTPSYAGMIPASVERLGGAILSERVEAMKIGSDDTTPLITVENTTTDKVIYGPTYIHPNRTNIGPSKLAQPPRSVSAGELNGDDNNNNNNGDMKKETPQYSPFDKRSKFKHHGASTKDTPPVKGREKRKYEFKNPSSGPAPLNRTDPVSLMYSNMHTVMAARELCIGLDNDIRNLDNLENQMGTLTDVLRGVLDQYGINRGDESISKIGYELDIVTDNVKSAANKARGQRKRAESIMKTEDNARHVFGWPAPKKVDPVATTTADDASAAAAGIIIQKGDVEAEAEGEVEGGVGLGGSK